MSFLSLLWEGWCRMQDDLPQFDDDVDERAARAGAEANIPA